MAVELRTEASQKPNRSMTDPTARFSRESQGFRAHSPVVAHGQKKAVTWRWVGTDRTAQGPELDTVKIQMCGPKCGDFARLSPNT